MKVYCYPKCSTCKKALKFLENNNYNFELLDISKEPPSYKELEEIINKSGLDIKKFFNTSGKLYREKNVKDKLADMTQEEKITLLSSNGMLIKRPLLINDDVILVGFKESEYKELKK
ncbi:arsenate reductase family protein [Miniphocaeibacter halophilus]|uniref:Arsenate reductase family protein n=1 Tax=Miniphocaeibacter halophilus TaxID=2931922 RepID=A0AC61MU06_9FIRM|nr:arsenate reductase family protein [Miniphocaeibacter halophilus]QQK07713.1 arsenate reductase family protein [Miniphocaeibacter halophilus]